MTIAKVIIVGSGPAGIGVASLLKQADIDYIVLEKNEIWHQWESNTRQKKNNVLADRYLTLCVQLPPSLSKWPHTSGHDFVPIAPLPCRSIRELVPELTTKRLRPQSNPPHISNPLRPLGLKESVPVAPERDIWTSWNKNLKPSLFHIGILNLSNVNDS